MEKTMRTDWHQESMLWFYETGLRDLLRLRIGAKSYEWSRSGNQAVDISVGMDLQRGPWQVAYRNLPLPDDSGVFTLSERRLVVIPVAESDDLERCRILCAGEQMLAYLADRIGAGPDSFAWEEDLVRGMAPLDRLIPEFLESVGQELDETNPFSAITHMRRLLSPNGRILPDSQLGRVCPVDMPEKPERLGKVLTICRGARIEDSRIEIVSDAPADRLSPVAALIPFVHHTDPMRAQMGVNLTRQWRGAARPEAALVQTGLEADPPTWLGCNLLTAFASHGKDTYEDSLLLSAGAAARLGFDSKTGVGALLSNRNGQKGVVGKILPDNSMPRLPGGTPVEIMVSFLGLHARMNTGQLLEAAASWIARRTEKPYIAAPFTEGDRERIDRALKDAPYRQRLRLGEGREAEMESLAGWVYWGVCAAHASNRLMVGGVLGEGNFMRQGEMENHVLIHRGAYRTIQERFTVLASEDREGPQRWSTLYGNLRRKLAAAGIKAEISESGVKFGFAEPEANALHLAIPLAHPWLPGQEVCSVGRMPEVDGFEELEKANRTLSDGSSLPSTLRAAMGERLQTLLDGYFSRLLTLMDVRMGNRVRQSGRGMTAIGAGISYDQVGVPRKMADALFGGRTPDWVVLNRAPTMEDTAIVAFHPVIVEGDAVQLNPYVCRWMNADFDGDQVAVLVPGSPETQEEAGRLLSVLGHVSADATTLNTLTPNQEALWGLARIWLSKERRGEIVARLPTLRTGEVPLTRQVLSQALQETLHNEGAEAAVRKAVQLWDLGFAESEVSGATMDPMAMFAFDFPAAPTGLDLTAWERHREHCTQVLAVLQGYSEPATGAQMLAVHSGARGELWNLIALTEGDGLLEDGTGRKRVVRSGFLPGMDFDGYAAHSTIDHERMAETASFWTEGRHPGFEDYRPYRPEGRHVIARAMRSKYPGIVFARAAAAGEMDPLTGSDARLFVGLLPLA